MTTNDLAAGSFRKCGDRLAALEVLHARAAFSDVVRESQEVVELALKGMLRWAGIDPPKIHDVGSLLLDFAERFEGVSRQELTALADASKELRKEREFSFYGDITSFRPTNTTPMTPTHPWAKRDSPPPASAGCSAVLQKNDAGRVGCPVPDSSTARANPRTPASNRSGRRATIPP
jgi:HEPN domain-containing protein